MLPPPKRWVTAAEVTPAARQALARFHPVLAQVLFNRGLADEPAARSFLAGRYERSTDPLGLAGMPATVDRLRAALRAGERIAVYGDYDTDGVTATALLVTVLQSLDADVTHYIPNRFEEGYGLNLDALDTLKEQGARVVVTVDCGIRSFQEAEHARRLGLDLIITDHHTVGEDLPDALAVVNPKQPADEYPEKSLAGVGLAYKLAQALLRAEARGMPEESLLDLVALGTVADLAPLTGENRELVRQGLRALNAPLRLGVRSLIGVSNAKPGQITAGTVGFVLGPRLNAAGRLDSALAAYELLTTQDREQAANLARELEEQNRRRQRITQETSEAAREIALAQEPDAPFLFAAHSDFQEGIVGLAAARLAEQFYRPAAVAKIGDTHTRGSARSVKEFHITEALDKLRAHLEKHGGHRAAAGFTLKNEKREALKAGLRAEAAAAFANGLPQPSLTIDAEVGLKELDETLVRQLAYLEPTGYGNPRPLLAARDLKVLDRRRVGKDGAHLQLTVSDGSATLRCIAFRFGDRYDALGPKIDLAFTPEINEWNGERSVQLNVRDIRSPAQ